MTTPKILSKFGSVVRSQRQKLKISQEELADRAHLHRTYISDIERGVRNLSLLNIQELAKALELKPSELFQRVEGL